MSSHDIVCLHTMVGGLAGTEAFFKQDGFGGVESHFGIGARGEIIQWQDLDFTADANLDGNHHVISIETADSGIPFRDWEGTNVPAWTEAQIESIVELVSWLCGHFDIPTSLIPDTKPGRRGIGYHRQGIEGSFQDGLVSGGERWSTSNGKVCPGDRRVEQLRTKIIPAVKQSQSGTGEAESQQDVIVLDHIVRAAQVSVSPSVRIVEKALVAEHLLDANRSEGMWGPITTAAYARWQRKCGFTGKDADGIPGTESLGKLGSAHGFQVRG